MSKEAVLEAKGIAVEMKSKVDIMYLCHCSIGLVLMFGFGYLSPIDPITPMGMKILGIFRSYLLMDNSRYSMAKFIGTCSNCINRFYAYKSSIC